MSPGVACSVEIVTRNLGDGVVRARIVLLSAERLAVVEVARRAGVSRPAVWRWQRRFAEHGVSGLLRNIVSCPNPFCTCIRIGHAEGCTPCWPCLVSHPNRAFESLNPLSPKQPDHGHFGTNVKSR